MLHWAVECEEECRRGKTGISADSAAKRWRNGTSLQPHISDEEYFLTLRVFTKEDAPMIPKGHEVAIEQWALPVSPVERKVRLWRER